ncbi:hypothetical protein [Alteromonas gracilis]|uniref:hypothetical protein n=1 Tax=Alteromonas gracilis TaxID=1479524 RepID=UPI0037360AB0
MQSSLVKGVLSLGLLSLVGCGGGGSDAPPVDEEVGQTPLFSVSGNVIDGYVSGATVWLDINGNGNLDSFEPSAVSGDAGRYSLELSEGQRSCIDYASMIVDVPVGAVDEDSGEVTEAYQMVLPPRLQNAIPLANADLFSITPLTTVLASQLESDLSSVSADPVSCNDLKNNAQLRQQVKDKLLEAVNTTVSRYNLSADTIFGDYIANDDQEAHSLALTIVKGLQAAYTYKAKLEADFPDAIYSRVEFAPYKHLHPDVTADFQYKDDWFRDITVTFTSGYYSEMMRMNDDLDQEQGVFFRRDVKDEPWGVGHLTSQWTAVEWGHNNEGNYKCSLGEYVSVEQDGNSYTLFNDGAVAFADTMEDCQPDSYSEGSERNFSVDYTENGISYESRFTAGQFDADYSALPNWVDLRDKANTLSFDELIAFFSTLPYKFDDPVTRGIYTYWYKRRTDDTGEHRVLEYKGEINNELEWYREVYQADGTFIKECTADGVTWAEC